MVMEEVANKSVNETEFVPVCDAENLEARNCVVVANILTAEGAPRCKSYTHTVQSISVRAF